jgi:Na+-translocating ferredoxin:NAD+ oxidoreductase subunit G
MTPETTTTTEPGTARLALTLGLVGLLAGIALVATYQVTLPIIERNKAEALRAAVNRVVPGTSRMQRLGLVDGSLVPVAGDQPGPSVYAAYTEGGEFRGYALVGEGAGFQDTIRLIYGYDPERRRITGMFVLESRETPGLGDKIFKDPAFVAEFDDLAVEPAITAVKGHGEAAHEVDAITGATISSQAIVDIINRANALWIELLPRAAPPVPPEPDGTLAQTEEAR